MHYITWKACSNLDCRVSRYSDLAGLGLRLRICIPDKFLGAAEEAGSETAHGELLLLYKILLNIAFSLVQLVNSFQNTVSTGMKKLLTGIPRIFAIAYDQTIVKTFAWLIWEGHLWKLPAFLPTCHFSGLCISFCPNPLLPYWNFLPDFLNI